MDLKEQIKQINEVMKETKVDWVATEPENDDLAIYLHFWRGEDMLVGVQCPVDRDTALSAASIGAMGFNADVMSVTFESYHSELGKSPVTGNDWMPHEMQYVSETVPDAAEKGWVRPCLTTTMHDRDGGYALYSLPYSLVEGKLTWGEHVLMVDGEDGTHGGGYMYDRLQHAMQQPRANDLIAQDQGNPLIKMISGVLDEETTLFHADMATARTLKDKELCMAVVLRAGGGTKREELLKNRFGETGTYVF